MADDTQHALRDAGEPERPPLYTFEELAALAAHNPLARSHCLEQIDDSRDMIAAWLDTLSLRHPQASGEQRAAGATLTTFPTSSSDAIIPRFRPCGQPAPQDAASGGGIAPRVGK